MEDLVEIVESNDLEITDYIKIDTSDFICKIGETSECSCPSNRINGTLCALIYALQCYVASHSLETRDRLSVNLANNDETDSSSSSVDGGETFDVVIN